MPAAHSFASLAPASSNDAPARSYAATSAGSEDAVRLVLEYGADPNQRGRRCATCALGEAPLAVAAADGAHSIVRLLLDAGADVNAVGEHGWTAAHHAAFAWFTDSLELLVERGALVDVEGARRHHHFVETVVIQVKRMADTEIILKEVIFTHR